MKTKNYMFTMKFEFIAENEQDAKDQLQEMIDEWEVHGIFNADNWNIEAEDVELSEIMTK